MTSLFPVMKRAAVVGALSLLAACGGGEAEDALAPEEVGESPAAITTCETYTKSYAYCVNELNLNGLATCPAGQYRGSITYQYACNNTSYRGVTWTCCTQ